MLTDARAKLAEGAEVTQKDNHETDCLKKEISHLKR